MYWADVEKQGFDPVRKQPTVTTRRELQINYDLPLGEGYAKLVAEILK